MAEDIGSMRDDYKALCHIDIDGYKRIGVLNFIIFKKVWVC